MDGKTIAHRRIISRIGLLPVAACLLCSLSCGTNLFWPPVTDANLSAFDFEAFGPDFMWGAGSSSHQVEGNNVHSDWWAWEQAGRTKSGEVSGKAVDHWNLFEQDMDRLSALELDTYRFSLNWARLFPTGPDEVDEEAAERYDRFFEIMAVRGITPMVTLHHFVMPQWLTAEDRWGSGEAIEDFRRFAEFAAKRWGKYVDWWITVNEPEVFAFHGWARGVFPPGKTDFGLAFKVFTHLMKAHAEAYEVIKAFDTIDADGDAAPAQVGIANLIVPIETASQSNLVEDIIATFIGNFANVFWFEANRTGIFDPKLPFVFGPFEEYPKFVNTLDFAGVNYYSRQVISFSAFGLQIGAPFGAVLSELGIELYPRGIYESLDLVAKYQLPIIITENGIADADDNDRERYIVSHLAEVARFIRDRPDIPVLGYVHWSLTDNYEWENGFAPRFGLFAIDYETLERTKRPSADTLSQIAVRSRGD